MNFRNHYVGEIWQKNVQILDHCIYRLYTWQEVELGWGVNGSSLSTTLGVPCVFHQLAWVDLFCPLTASIPFLWSALFIHLIFFPSTSEKFFKNHKIWFRQIDTSETWDISKFIQIYSPHSCSSHTACPHGCSISGLSLWILWMLEPLFPTFLLLMNILRWQSLVLTDNSAEICHQKCKVAFVGGYW